MAFSADRKRELRTERYGEYLALIDELGMEPQHRWVAHHDYLLNGERFRSLTKAELFAYWKERFTDNELASMGGAIDSLLSEEEAA